MPLNNSLPSTRMFLLPGTCMLRTSRYYIPDFTLDLTCISKVTSLVGDCDVNSGDKRPVFYCVKDKKVEGLYWAIPYVLLNMYKTNI